MVAVAVRNKYREQNLRSNKFFKLITDFSKVIFTNSATWPQLCFMYYQNVKEKMEKKPKQRKAQVKGGISGIRLLEFQFQLNYICSFFKTNNFLFPFFIKNTTNNKTQELFIYKKNERKSNLQSKTEPLPNLHLVVPRQHINLKRTYFLASF